MKRFKILYFKKKSWAQDVVQKLFLIILKKFFPEKSLIYKNKIKILISKTKLFIFLLSRVLILRLKYPLYFNLPKKHLYGIYLLIKFSNFFNTHNINFFFSWRGPFRSYTSRIFRRKTWGYRYWHN